MPRFSKKSLSLLEKCHKDIQTVAHEVIKKIDFTVLDSTVRTVEQQKEFVATGKSKTMNSKHLTGQAIDIAPYPVNWKDTAAFAYLAGYWIGVAENLLMQGKISSRFRWGGDWNMNGKNADESFSDIPHIEII